MSGNFQRNNDVERVLGATDIVALVGRYIPLKKAGTNYKALCPFHSEKTPSFTVNPIKQIFYCFGCGRGGDAISFITAYENTSFREALKTLAQESGIELEGFVPIDKEKRRKELEKIDSIYRINLSVLGFYKENIRRSDRACGYIKHRRISAKAQETFFIGYAPSEWDSLLRYLKEKGHSENELLEAGLIAKSEKTGRYYDRFRDRVIFPIHDIRSRVIGFGARAIPPSDAPKYINSPETPVFSKRDNLFGLHIAKEHIRRTGYAIITEGYLDVISAFEAGVLEAVAPLGTALTDSHIKLLSRYTSSLVLVFDSDKAGVNAVYRAFENIVAYKIKASVVMLPEAHDLDSFVKEFGREAFVGKIGAAVPLIEFLLESVIRSSNLSSVEGEIEAVERAMPILRKIDDEIVRSRYIAHFSEITKISKIAIEDTVRRENNRQVKRTFSKDKVIREENIGARKAQVDFVKQMIREPESTRESIVELESSFFSEGYVRDVFSRLKQWIEQGEISADGNISARFMDNDECRDFVSSVLMEEDGPEFTAQHISQCMSVIKGEYVKKRIKQLQNDIRTLARKGEMVNPELIEEYTKLSQSLLCPAKQAK